MDLSIVILTYNRPYYLEKLLYSLDNIGNIEVIVVDNYSDQEYVKSLQVTFSKYRYIFLERNYGAVGRNFGIEQATGKYIITLDDDIWGLCQKDIDSIINKFEQDPALGAICFKVIEENTGITTNWMHHRDKSKFSDTEFETYEISEGAVALNKRALDKTGLYPIEYFISHEGTDLAFRLINNDYKVIYSPEFTVTHAHAQEGRAGWRRYYFDTRNLIWLAYSNYNLRMLLKRFPVQILAMLVYSVRDGYIFYWGKGVIDALTSINKFNRNPIGDSAYNTILEMDKFREPFIKLVKTRLFKKGIKM